MTIPEAAQPKLRFKDRLKVWMASEQSELATKINDLRKKAFKSNAFDDREAYYQALSSAFQLGNLVVVDAAIRALSQGTSSERAQALEEGISHAIVLIDEQLEKHHDFEGDTPQSSALRDISHHLQGTLIASGEIALSQPVSPDMGVERPVEGGWLPIETAPKDGTSVEVYDSFITGTDGFAQVIARHDKEHGWHVSASVVGGIYIKLTNPTHWRPLPASPGASE